MPAQFVSPSSFLAAHAERLRRSSWGNAFGNAWLTLMACAFLKVVLPAALVHALRPWMLMAPIVPLIAKDLAHWPDALARSRSALAAHAWDGLVLAWLPPELVGLVRLDAQLRRGFVEWLLRRPRPQAPAGQVFGYLERGAYRTVVAIALVSLLVELPIHAIAGSLLLRDPAERHLVHLLLIVGSLSSLAWVMGDRWWIGQGQHVLDAHDLHLRVGARTVGNIPRTAIAGCQRLTGSAAAWCRDHAIDPRAALRASPFDKPNAVLMLKEGSQVRVHHLGRERTGLACVFLYLDRPADLSAALRQA
jgi:hypothetical protein